MKNKPETVSTLKLAQILGISDRRVLQLVSEGILKKEGRSKFALNASVQAYITYQVELVKQKQITGTLLEEQTRLTAAKADREEMEIARLQGELLPANVVSETWQKIIASARTRMLGLPSVLKTQHPDLDLTIVAKLEEIVRQTLTEISADGIPASTE